MVSIFDDGDDPEEFLKNADLHIKVPNTGLIKPWMKHHKFVCVRTIEEVVKLIDDAIASGRCSLDLETEGLDNRIRYDAQGNPSTYHNVVGFCLSYGDGHAGYYIPVGHEGEDGEVFNLDRTKVYAEIRRLCLAAQPVPPENCKDPLSFRNWKEPGKVKIYFWYAKFDQEFLYPITGIDWWHPDSFEDGLLACFVKQTSDDLGLKEKAGEVLRDPEGHPYEMIKLDDLFVKGRKKNFATLAPDEPGVIEYAGSDGICTLLLGIHPTITPYVLAPDKAATLGSTYRLEKQVIQVMRVLERNRVFIDQEKVIGLLEDHRKKRAEMEVQIQALAKSKGFTDFNIGSTQQLGELLFSPQGLDISPKPPRNEKSQQYATGYDALDELLKTFKENDLEAPAILQWVLDWREHEKILGTYLEKLAKNPDENGEVRVKFSETGAETGRFSAPQGDNSQGYSGIPMHGIPGASAVREAFRARKGYTMVKADYAGQELRIAANVSGEMVWIKEFLEGEGDLHSITARAFFGKEKVTKEERKMGKCVHPDTLVIDGGKLVPVGSFQFSPTPDSFHTLEGSACIYDGQTYQSLTATYNGGIKPLVHVVTTSGILTCTHEHLFKMRDGSFTKAGDLQEGDLLEIPSIPSLLDKPYETLSLSLWEGIPKSLYTLSHDLSYFAGLYAGDGSGNDSSVCLTHGPSEKLDAYGTPYEEWIQSLENSSICCGFTTTRKDSSSLYLGSRVVVRLFTELGLQRKRQKNLRVPSWVLQAGKTSFLHYMAGLIDTDGTVGSRTPSIEWTTKDFVFAGQVTTALKACGLDFFVELTFNQTYQRYYVRVRFSVKSSWELHPYLKHKGKAARLRPPIYDGRSIDRYTVRKVLDAKEGPCLDLTVDPTHVYLANGYITHNTANFALVYGGGPASIQRATGCNRDEARRRKAAFDQAVPTFAKWVKGQHAEVKKLKGVINPFGRWIAIPDAAIKAGDVVQHGKQEPRVLSADEAQAIRAACERHSTNYPIQSSGADIMKISLVLLHKTFYENGWLKSGGGEDSVRMLLTVHDEIVFEVRNDRVAEVLPVIKRVMAAPGQIPRPPFSPIWRVPLVVEPLLGTTWAGDYNWDMIMEGKPAKEGYTLEKLEVQVGDRIYHKVPPWLEGILIPPWKQDATPDTLPETEDALTVGPETPISSTPKATIEPEKSIVEESVRPITPPLSNIPTPVVPTPVVPTHNNLFGVKSTQRVHFVMQAHLNRHTVKQLVEAIRISLAWVRQIEGAVLCMSDPMGNVLIPDTEKIMVDPDLLQQRLRDLNITYMPYSLETVYG